MNVGDSFLETGRERTKIVDELAALAPDPLGVGAHLLQPLLSLVAELRDLVLCTPQLVSRFRLRGGHGLLCLGSRLGHVVGRFGFGAVGLGAGIDDDARGLCSGRAKDLFRLSFGGVDDLNCGLASPREHGAPLVLGPLERVLDCIPRRAGRFQLCDQAVDPRDVRVNRPALVTSARDGEGDIANRRGNASLLAMKKDD